MRRTVALALTLVLLAPALARAHDHQPPDARVSVGEATQKGTLFQSCWWRAMGEPNYYFFICIDGFMDWPRRMVVAPGSTATVRFDKAAEPTEIQLHRWRRVDPDYGIPQGRAREVPFTLAPVLEGEETVAWEATFTVPERLGHHYVTAFGIWADEEGTEQPQDAAWTFHLRAR
jgi:hypothetical protein